MSRGPNAQPVRYYERTSMYYHRLWEFRYTASLLLSLSRFEVGQSLNAKPTVSGKKTAKSTISVLVHIKPGYSRKQLLD